MISRMKPVELISLILIIVLALYLTISVFVITSIGHYNARLKKCLLGISIILSERKQFFLSLVDEFQEMGVNFRGSDIVVFDQVRALKVDSLKADEVSPISDLFREAESRFRFLAGKNPWATKSAKYQDLWSALEELDANYRQALVNYNSQLAFYNYWVKVPLCHWIPWLFGLRYREALR